MTVHRTVRSGYAASSDAYERARPGYPPEAVVALTEALDIGPGRRVLELGAGTGKFTRSLGATGAEVVAVEPVAQMRAHLAGAVPAALVVGAAAEAIPLVAHSADAVVAATAFHWFTATQALAEIGRVLRPGGGLGLIWNNPDLGHDWVAAVWGLVASKRGEAPRNRDLVWKQAFEQEAMFSALEHRCYSHEEWLGLDDLLARVGSISFVAALPSGERGELLDRVREIAATHPALRGRDRFAMPYLTDVYYCHKLA